MFVELQLTLLFQSISSRKWAGNRCTENSYNILEYLTCKVKKPPWWDIRNFQHFSSTKEQNLQKKLTLSHLWAWNNVHTDMFYNLPKDWLANCLSGSLQFAVVRFAIHRLTFSNHSPVWNCHDVFQKIFEILMWKS